MLLSILIPGKFDHHIDIFNRLALNLFQTLDILKEFGKDDVEVVLCDWGSETKITDQLGIETSDYFRCAYVDPETAKKYNKDAGYSIVHPINTAFRHSRGKYVIFWDSDGFVPLLTLKSLYEFVSWLDRINDKGFYWGARYHIPNEIHVNERDPSNIISYISKTPLYELRSDNIDIHNFMGGPISLLMNREVWEDSTGWWEELTYWGWQDIEFHRRLHTKYPFGGDLKNWGIIFYHLEHPVSPLGATRQNPQICSSTFKANGDNWGLKNEMVLVY